MNTIDKNLQWNFEGKAFYVLPDGVISSRDNGYFCEKGKAVSGEFPINDSFLIFDLALYAFDSDTYAEVQIDGKREFFISGSIMGSSIKKFSLDVTRFKGKMAKFVLCDAGVWERMTLKNVRFSDSAADGTVIMKPEDECVPFDVTLKVEGARFLNIPVDINQNAGLCNFAFDTSTEFNMFVRLATGGTASRFASVPIDEYAADSVRIFSESIMLPKDTAKEVYDSIKLTDVPIGSKAFYSEQGRPKLHFTSPFGGIGDMIGFYCYDGKYNIGYLHDAGFDNWNDNATWAYSESRDLFRWGNHRTVIRKGFNTRCTSGCAFVDKKNASGLKNGDDAPILLFYGLETQHGQRFQDFSDTDTESAHKEHLTKISVKYSTDGGKSFSDYSANPLFRTRAIGGHDPEVFYFAEKDIYVMVIHDKHCGKWGFDFYTSENLLDWTYRSTIPDMWETPNMYPLALDGDRNKVFYVLQQCDFSYYIGAFDGEKFIPVSEKISCFKGAYAMRSFDTDRRIVMGNVVKTFGENGTFTGSRCATLPMEVVLKSTKSGMRLFYKPAREIDSLVLDEKTYTDISPFDFNSLGLKAGLWDIEIDTYESFSLYIGEKEILSCNSDEMTYTVCNLSGKFVGDSCNIRLIIDGEVISYFSDGGLEAGVADAGNAAFCANAVMTISCNTAPDKISLRQLRSPY